MPRRASSARTPPPSAGSSSTATAWRTSSAHAKVPDNTLHLSVPAERVDDFLRSLTVSRCRDRAAGAGVLSQPDRGAAVNGLVDMKIGLLGSGPHDLKLSYVTEAPAWKPSYRFILGAERQGGAAGVGGGRQHLGRGPGIRSSSGSARALRCRSVMTCGRSVWSSVRPCAAKMFLPWRRRPVARHLSTGGSRRRRSSWLICRMR